MKMNIIKYLFVTFVIALTALAVYILYKDTDTKAFDMSNQNKQGIIYRDITLGICGYDTINPILSKNKDIQYIDKLIFDSLIIVTKDFKLENSLAEECSKIGPTVYLIKLKEDKIWHNGDGFTAYDVKFTIDNLKNTENDSIYKENAKNISGVEIIDEFTVKIYLNEETPFFEYMLTFPILSMNTYNESTLESTTEIPIGTGNYRMVSITEEKVELEKREKNLDYKIEKIHINLYSSLVELYRAFKEEKVDLVITNNIDYKSHTGKFGVNENILQDREFDYIAINTRDKVLSDSNVRHAINYAINRKEILYNVYENKYIPASFPIGYGSYLYKDYQQETEYNIIKAKQVLIDSGWEYKDRTWVKRNSSDILDFDLIVNENNEKRVEVAENIEKQLAQVGIKIRIRKVNDITFENYLIYKNYDLILTGNILPLYPDISTYFNENNFSNYYNEEVFEILNEIGYIQNQDILKEKYKRVIEIYERDMPFISLYFNGNIVLYNSHLKGNMERSWYNIFYNIGSWYRIN